MPGTRSYKRLWPKRNRGFWHGAKPLDIPSGGRFLPNQTRLLRASNEFFTAGAVWQRKDGQWSCIQAAPILAWMFKLTPTAAKLELARKGCSWEWISVGPTGILGAPTAPGVLERNSPASSTPHVNQPNVPLKALKVRLPGEPTESARLLCATPGVQVKPHGGSFTGNTRDLPTRAPSDSMPS